MRIGINATCLNDRPSGAKSRFIGIYGQLFKFLYGHEFVIYEPADCYISSWFVNQPNIKSRKTPVLSTSRLSKIGASARYWNQALRDDELNLYEIMSLPILRSPPSPAILTIHDLRSINVPVQRA